MEQFDSKQVSEKQTDDVKERSGHSRFKRIAAMTGVILLVAIYVLTLITALLDIADWRRFFFASIGATIVVPLFIWINMFLYDRLVDKS